MSGLYRRVHVADSALDEEAVEQLAMLDAEGWRVVAATYEPLQLGQVTQHHGAPHPSTSRAGRTVYLLRRERPAAGRPDGWPER